MQRVKTIMGITRVAGISVVFLTAFAVFAPESAVAEDATCSDYTIDACVDESECFEQAEEPCGDDLSEECRDEGYIACGYAGDPECVVMVCLFGPE